MSTTATATAQELAPSQLPAGDVFDAVVWESDEYCNGCFARIRDIETIQATDTNRLGTGNRPDEVRDRVGAGVLGYDAIPHGPHGTKCVHPPQTYCNECGANGGRAPDAERSLRRAIADAIRLSATLDAHDVAHSQELLCYVVERGKRRDDIRGRDTELYRRATRLAVERPTWTRHGESSA